MKIDCKVNKEKIKFYLKTYCKGREGIEALVEMLDRTDFYTAPASTKYHLSVEGGVGEHSLNVLEGMIQFLVMDSLRSGDLDKLKYVQDLVNMFLAGEEIDLNNLEELEKIVKEVYGPKVSLSSLVICSLLHDSHKINFYERVEKKIYKGLDDFGKKVFETEETWGVRKDHLILGNEGTTSNYIIQCYMKLTYEEILAIENHHGIDRNQNPLISATPAYSKSKLALYLHLADMRAAFTEDTTEQ